MGIIKDTLEQLNQQIKVRGAMPGHKGKLALDAGHDITELTGADNLQNPVGMIREAEAAAARIYGTQAARYLVNGSSCGNLTMIFSFFEEGDEILVERSSHKSVYNAILLRKLKPVYLWPETDEQGSSLPQSPAAVRRALAEHPQVKGVLLTMPSYKGYLDDYGAIWDAVRESGACLLIDGAHGAALAGVKGFQAFYRSCDAMVVSAHKSLACLNQGALLLSNRRDVQARILKYSNIFQTSSPSYLIMESIESSLEDLAAGMYLDPPDFRKTAYRYLTIDPLADGLRKDPWKVLVYAPGRGNTMEIFLEERGIYPEMHDANSVLLMLSPYNGQKEFTYLKAALQSLDEHLGGATPLSPPKFPGAMPRPRQCRMPWQVGDAFQEVELAETVGMIAQEQVIPYPPGIPILVPGEVIDAAMIRYIQSLIDNEVEIIGLHGHRLRCLWEEH